MERSDLATDKGIGLLICTLTLTPIKPFIKVSPIFASVEAANSTCTELYKSCFSSQTPSATHVGASIYQQDGLQHYDVVRTSLLIYIETCKVPCSPSKDQIDEPRPDVYVVLLYAMRRDHGRPDVRIEEWSESYEKVVRHAREAADGFAKGLAPLKTLYNSQGETSSWYATYQVNTFEKAQQVTVRGWFDTVRIRPVSSRGATGMEEIYNFKTYPLDIDELFLVVHVLHEMQAEPQVQTSCLFTDLATANEAYEKSLGKLYYRMMSEGHSLSQQDCGKNGSNADVLRSTYRNRFLAVRKIHPLDEYGQAIDTKIEHYVLVKMCWLGQYTPLPVVELKGCYLDDQLADRAAVGEINNVKSNYETLHVKKLVDGTLQRHYALKHEIKGNAFASVQICRSAKQNDK